MEKLMEQGRLPDKLALAANRNIKEREYWLKKLSGDLIKSSFPGDKIVTSVKEYSFNSLQFRFTDELFHRLMNISGGSAYTIHVIMVAGLVILLNKYTGNEDIIVGSPIYKQDIEEEFINTILILRN